MTETVPAVCLACGEREAHDWWKEREQLAAQLEASRSEVASHLAALEQLAEIRDALQRERAQAIVDLLNEAHQLDPGAVHALVCNRVPCNSALRDHPTIQADGSWEGFASVGLLGILNGVAGKYGELIEMVYENVWGRASGDPPEVRETTDPPEPGEVAQLRPARFLGFRLRPEEALPATVEPREE